MLTAVIILIFTLTLRFSSLYLITQKIHFGIMLINSIPGLLNLENNFIGGVHSNYFKRC